MLIRSLPLVALGLLSLWPNPAAKPATLVTSTPDQVQDPDPESAKTCAMCHKVTYEEWNGRAHSRAWTDEIYQAAIKKKKRAKMCHSCHIPRRVLARVGRKPKTRKTLLHEGVTCVSCHEKDGKIHGPFGAKTDAHESVKDPLFTDAHSSKLCMSCHSTKIDVVLPVGKHFRDSKLEAKGESCAGCHMPEVTRHIATSPTTGKPVGEKRKARSHRLLGPNDAEFCAKAFKLGAKKAGGQMLLSMGNETGHGVPGLRTRAFHFSVRQKDKAGKTVSDKKIVINSDNALIALETREFPFKLAAGAVTVEVTIEHHFEEKLVAQISSQKFKL